MKFPEKMISWNHVGKFSPILSSEQIYLNRKWLTFFKLSSVQFSRSVVSNSATPWIAACQASLSITNSRVYSDSGPSSPWCHPAISSSVIPFSSCPQSLPASGFFPMSQLFAWGGQSTGASALASFLPKKSQGWLFRLYYGKCCFFT